MGKPELNIPRNAARLDPGSLRKAKQAVEAVAEIAEVKDDTGKITIKAVAAITAVPAEPSVQVMKVKAVNSTIISEMVVRLALEGIHLKDGDVEEALADGVSRVFVCESQAIFRAAFAKCKGDGVHNAKGFAIFQEDQKAKAAKKPVAEKKDAGKETGWDE